MATYRQVITPNLDPYIFSGGKMIVNWLGWCMGYVYSAFANMQKNGVPKIKVNTAPSAHQGWLDCKYKHKDKDFPTDVYIPLWFDWWGTVNGVYANWGHTLIYKNGKIWTSPLSDKATADTFNSLDAVIKAFGGQIKYVGWSEDVCGTRVIQEAKEKKEMLTKNGLTVLRRHYTGKSPTQKELKDYVGKVTFDEMAKRIWTWPSYKNSVAASKKGTIKLLNYLPGSIRDVYKPIPDPTIAKLQTDNKKLAATNSDLTAQVKDLKSQVAASGTDTAQLNSLGKLLNWFITRLGLRS